MNRYSGSLLAACVAGTLLFAATGSGSGTSPLPEQRSSLVLPSPKPTPADGPVAVSGRYQSLIFTLSSPQQIYKAGDTATLTLTVQNTGSSDVTGVNFYINDGYYVDEAAAAQGIPPSVGGAFLAFLPPADPVFKAGETVTQTVTVPLTAFYQPLTFVKISASSPMTPQAACSTGTTQPHPVRILLG